MDDITSPASERFFTERETARFLRLSQRTLQRHRRQGSGPKFVKMRLLIRYRVRDVAEWTDACTHLSQSQVTHGR